MRTGGGGESTMEHEDSKRFGRGSGGGGGHFIVGCGMGREEWKVDGGGFVVRRSGCN